MINSIENARKFLEPNPDDQNIPHWSVAVTDYMEKKLVAYASQITPSSPVSERIKIVVPSDVQIQKEYSSNMAILDELSSSDIFQYGVQWVIGRLKSYTLISDDDIRRLFRNKSNCYADTWVRMGRKMLEGDVIQAMTEDAVIELIRTLNPGAEVVEADKNGTK